MAIHPDKLNFLFRVNEARQRQALRDAEAAKKKAAEEDEKKPPKKEKP